MRTLGEGGAKFSAEPPEGHLCGLQGPGPNPVTESDSSGGRRLCCQ